MMIYVGHNKPYLLRSVNLKEMVNEWFIITSVSVSVMFTDFCHSLHTKFYVAGYSYIGLVVLVVLFNLCFILMGPLRWLRLRFIRYSRRLHRRYEHYQKALELRRKFEMESSSDSSISQSKEDSKQIESSAGDEEEKEESASEESKEEASSDEDK